MAEEVIGGTVVDGTVVTDTQPVTGHDLEVVSTVASERHVAAAEGSTIGVSNGNAGTESRPTGLHDARQQPVNRVKGRIEISDEVVQKVAAIAAYEVEGVADLGGGFARAWESLRDRIGIGEKRDDQGVRARTTDRDVEIDVKIVVEYGNVIRDVAQRVQSNIALRVHKMLRLRVLEVNVRVDDVEMPKKLAVEGEQAHDYNDSSGYVTVGDYD